MAVNAKVIQIMDVALALLALVLGVGMILGGIGLSFFRAVSDPLTSGPLGAVVGVVFLFHALRYFNVIR